MRDTPVEQMRHLRSQARKLGLTIQTQRATRTEPVRYRVVDPATGQAVGTDLPRFDDVQALLWRVVRDRERVLVGEPPVAEVPRQRCPACGTPRVAFFRLCLTCGLDYEAEVKPPPEAHAIPLNGLGSDAQAEAAAVVAAPTIEPVNGQEHPGTVPPVAPPPLESPLPGPGANVPVEPLWQTTADPTPWTDSDPAIRPRPEPVLVVQRTLEPPAVLVRQPAQLRPPRRSRVAEVRGAMSGMFGTLRLLAAWAILALVAAGLVTVLALGMR